MINLSKGSNINLTKTVAASGGELRYLQFGLGWDARTTDGTPFDLDAQAIILGEDGKVLNSDPSNFVFYNNRTAPGVSLSADNTTGVGEGDDEVLSIDLQSLDPAAVRIVIAVSIYEEGETKRLSFGQVRRATCEIRATDSSGVVQGAPLAGLDCSEDASTELAMLVCETYQHNGEWKVRSVGQGYADGLAGLARDFGLDA
jgi:tellurium resistance protein TerD